MPPDMVVGGLRFYDYSIFCLFVYFFVSYPLRSLNRTQPNLTTFSEVSQSVI